MQQVRFIRERLQEFDGDASRPEFAQQLSRRSDDQRVTRALSDLHDLRGRTFADTVKSIETWWHQLPRHDPKYRFGVLCGLLKWLDDYVRETWATRGVLRIEGDGSDGEAMLIGRRWWDARARALSPDQRTQLDRGAFDVFRPFPHLRVDRGPSRFVRQPKLFRHARRRGFLLVGLAPLAADACTTFEPTAVIDQSVFGFRATGMSHPGYEEDLRQVIRDARNRGIHILLMPELSVCDVGLRVLRDEIRENGAGEIELMVAGSFHRGDGVPYNEAPVWVVNERGIDVVLVERKAQPLPVERSSAAGLASLSTVVRHAEAELCEGLREDIVPGAEVSLLDTPLGIFGVVICRDALTGEKIRRAEQLADHLLVVSMNSTPAAWFYNDTARRVREYVTATYYVNAAQVVGDDDVELAFWSAPRRSSDTHLVGRYCRSQQMPNQTLFVFRLDVGCMRTTS